MNKLAKIQHKIIELVVGSSAVPVIAYRGITLNTFIFECELLGQISFVIEDGGFAPHHLANYYLIMNKKELITVVITPH